MIVADSAGFDFVIDKWVPLAKGNTLEFAIEFIQDLNEAVILATPVKFGFLRGSWHAAISGAPAAAGGAADPSGAASVSRLNLIASSISLGDVFTAVNGASYAGFLEFGTAHIAPRMFVRGTLARADAIAEAAANRVAARTP